MAAGETVTVACKLPHGLKLRVFAPTKKIEPMTSREVTVFEEIPDATFTVFGNAHAQNAAPRCLIIGGFALTPGVPKDLWDAWLEQNKDSDVVKNNLIFAHAKDQAASSAAQSKERAELRSGLERLDPNKRPKSIELVKASDRQAA